MVELTNPNSEPVVADRPKDVRYFRRVAFERVKGNVDGFRIGCVRRQSAHLAGPSVPRRNSGRTRYRGPRTPPCLLGPPLAGTPRWARGPVDTSAGSGLYRETSRCDRLFPRESSDRSTTHPAGKQGPCPCKPPLRFAGPRGRISILRVCRYPSGCLILTRRCSSELGITKQRL